MSTRFQTLILPLGKLHAKAQQLAVLRRQLVMKSFLGYLSVLVFGLEIAFFNLQVAEPGFQGSDFGFRLANLGLVVLQFGFVRLAFCVCFAVGCYKGDG